MKIIVFFLILIACGTGYSQEKLEKVFTPKNIYGVGAGLAYDFKTSSKIDEGALGLNFEIAYKYSLIESYAGVGANLGGSAFFNNSKKDFSTPPYGATDLGFQNTVYIYLTPLAFVKFEPFFGYAGYNLGSLLKRKVYKYSDNYYTTEEKSEFIGHPVIGAGLMFFSRSINKNTQRWGFYISAEAGFLNDKFIQSKLNAGAIYVY